jgi:hypothetical protein
MVPLAADVSVGVVGEGVGVVGEGVNAMTISCKLISLLNIYRIFKHITSILGLITIVSKNYKRKN